MSAQEERANPENALEDPELNAGVEAWMNGNIDLCYKTFRSAYQKRQDLSPPGVLIALLFSNTEQYASVRNWLERAVYEDPEDPEALFHLAGIAIQEKRLVEAGLLIEHGEKVLEQFKRTRTQPEYATRSRYLSRELLSLKSNRAEERGFHAQAETFIRTLVEQEPENDDALLSLGFILFKQEKWDEAEQIFDRARTLNKKHLPGWLLLSKFLGKEGKIEKAQELFSKHFLPQELDSYDDSSLLSIVHLMMQWGQMKEAEDLIRTLQRQNPDRVFIWLLNGELALYRHQYRIAEDHFQRALLLDPDRSEAKEGLTLAWIDQSDPEKRKRALALAEEQWKEAPHSIDSTGIYAWLLFLSGEKKKAEQIFDSMLNNEKISATVAYYLAEMAHARGEENLAMNFITLALDEKLNYPKKEAVRELKDIVEKKQKQLETASPKTWD